ncbi:MAG TPA: preprotein translocase subunit YajC [Spirochaetota bacterium]|nr:preprotein translocase subunit YajC [Spirochaetota bacterium]HOR45153.1 preprotein translocase subunit YajC [Spirochaetota bacterium]HOU85098.1 preprotein translocase subunit YajC [Spirochaetota bacterium]HPK56664.1 preprotein translocase subunit YajC [Spirochaetota bacterium]HQE57895.1 preprotein translocase subunit YajC [Spirochaetota bacterium]
MLFENLYAQSQPAAAGGSLVSFIIPMVLMMVVFYFLLIRPQQKKEKQRIKMIDSLQKGDRVLTVGGIYGVVSALKPEEAIVVLKISDNTKIEVTKASIQQKLV